MPMYRKGRNENYIFGRTLIKKYGKDYLLKLYTEYLPLQGSPFERMARKLNCSRHTVSMLFFRIFKISTPNRTNKGHKIDKKSDGYRRILESRARQLEITTLWTKIVKIYSREDIIDFYFWFLDVSKLSAALEINYSTFNKVLRHYNLNCYKLRSLAFERGLLKSTHIGKKRNLEERKLQSITRRAKIKSGEIDISVQLRALNAHGIPTSNTSIERALQEELKKRNISFETQKRIPLDESCTYVDIFIKPNICVYADGLYWHKFKKTVDRDNRHNQSLNRLGYKVYRFTDTQIKENVSSCISQIKEV